MTNFDVLTSGKPPSLEAPAPPVAAFELAGVLEEDEHPGAMRKPVSTTEPNIDERSHMAVEATVLLPISQ